MFRRSAPNYNTVAELAAYISHTHDHATKTNRD